MLKKRKLAAWGAVVCLLMLAMSSVTVFAAEEAAEYVPQMYASFWALVPPVVAIVLALITKEVYSSLFVGIVIGGLFWSGFSFENTVLHVFQDAYRFFPTGCGVVPILRLPFPGILFCRSGTVFHYRKH